MTASNDCLLSSERSRVRVSISVHSLVKKLFKLSHFFQLVQGLKDWCQSISNNAVDNSHLDTITVQFRVRCGSMEIDYNEDRMRDIGSKILLDSNRANPSEKPDLYGLWRLHPDLRAHCCFPESNYHITILNKLIQFDDLFYENIRVLTSKKLIIELHNVSFSNPDDPFCTITHALCFVSKARLLPPSKQDWTTLDVSIKDAILLDFILLMQEKPTEFGGLTEPSDDEQKDILVRLMNLIISSVQQSQIEDLKTLVCFLPSWDYAPTTSCSLDNLCIFLKTVEQLLIFIDEVNIHERVNERNQVILNTGIDYKEFLTQKQLDRILQVLNEYQATSLKIANELKNHITNKFSELRSYYEQVADFNAEIAEADISYIQGRLTSIQERVDTVVDVFDEKYTWLLFQTLLAANLEVAEETIQLSLEVADAMNPIAWLVGGASPNDILNAVQEVADAIAQLAKGYALLALWISVNDKANEINDKIQDNKDFLDAVKNIVFERTSEFETSKARFLSKYAEYNPELMKDDIFEMAGLWGKIVEETCSVLDGLDTAAASAVKIIVNSLNYCVDIPVLAQRMGEMYVSIYDFQFELMDSLAAYMRSRVNLDAAQEINDDFTALTEVDPNSDSTLDTLQMMGGLTYLTYKAHILEAVNQYCDLLEYKTGGVRPQQCRGPDTDLAIIVSTTIPSCVAHTYGLYYVPSAQNTSNITTYTSVDISKLFDGASVNFKIPDSQWLIDHKWIEEYERDYAFYVEKFEVYLPTKSKHPNKFVVFADPILSNVIVPHHGTEYMIIPHIPFVHEYILGPRRTICQDQKIPNPYTACETKSTSTVCQRSHKVYRHAFPSIYSQWAISVKGAEHMTPPNPATDLSLIFGIQMCKHVPIDVKSKFRTVFSEENMDVGECCLSGNFRPNATADCQACPMGSHSALAGYYCERNN